MPDARPRKNDRKIVSCPVETTIAAVGGRWKVLVIHHLLKGPQRFGELTRLLGGISARTLTRQLRELEDCHVIDRHVYQQIPPKVEYSLTPLGEELKPVLIAMHAWGEKLEALRTPKVSRKPRTKQAAFVADGTLRASGSNARNSGERP